jgi:hypothetical protein
MRSLQPHAAHYMPPSAPDLSKRMWYHRYPI